MSVCIIMIESVCVWKHVRVSGGMCIRVCVCVCVCVCCVHLCVCVCERERVIEGC